MKIGDEVTVTVLAVRGLHVRLGFGAPKAVTVHREEVYERRHAVPADSAQAARVQFLSATLRR